MEKILFATSANAVSPESIEFACHLCQLSSSELKGLLIDIRLPYDSARYDAQLEVFSDDDLTVAIETYRQSTQADISPEIEKTFRNAANTLGISASIRDNYFYSIDEIINETRFADVIILDSSLYSITESSEPDDDMLHRLLRDSRCPVILAPVNGVEIENIVFFYNGSKSSMFAIRQFTYLFPQFKDRKAVVLNVSDDLPSLDDQQLLTNWLLHHYRTVEIIGLNGNPGPEFCGFMEKKHNDFVVMGPYGRGLLQSFLPSSGDNYNAAENSLPIFITHY